MECWWRVGCQLGQTPGERPAEKMELGEGSVVRAEYVGERVAEDTIGEVMG